jgi:hypothetical protein
MAAGIHIGRRHVHGALLSRQRSRWKVETLARVALAQPLFEGVSDQVAEAGLVAALQQVSAGFKQGFMPIRIALPDTVIRSSVFELDDLPRSPKLQQELLRWRFSKTLQRDEDTFVCTGQPLGAAGDKQLLFAQALEKDWYAMTQRALQQAGIQPWSLNAQSAYQHNVYRDACEHGSGALISVDMETWGFQLWDSARRLRYVRSRWREGALDFEWISSEIERVIRSQASAAQGFQVERLHIAGGGQEVDALQQVLNRNLHQQVHLLPLPGINPEAMLASTDNGFNPAVLTAISNEN